jgi:hypothetical protein
VAQITVSDAQRWAEVRLATFFVRQGRRERPANSRFLFAFGLPGATAAGSGLRAVTRVCVGDSRLAPERKKRPARLVADRNELAAAMSLEVKFQTELELARIEGRRGPAVETAIAGA